MYTCIPFRVTTKLWSQGHSENITGGGGWRLLFSLAKPGCSHYRDNKTVASGDIQETLLGGGGGGGTF